MIANEGRFKVRPNTTTTLANARKTDLGENAQSLINVRRRDRSQMKGTDCL